MKLMERKYISKNGVIERTRYAVGDNAKPRRGRRRGNTSFRKQEQNFNSALRRVARILNCNYSHENGILLTLDYDAAGLEKLMGKLEEKQQEVLKSLRIEAGKIGTWQVGKKMPARGRLTAAPTGSSVEGACTGGRLCPPLQGDNEREDAQEALAAVRTAADKQMSLWLRRVKRKYAAQGGNAKIKALIITSDVDHKTGELVRVHHHIVMAVEGGISWDLLQAEWKLGSVDIRQLRTQPDYTPIATYLMRQVRRQPDAKKYRVTQGMEMPQVEERVVLSHAEIKAPAGANVLERSEFSIDCVGQYIRYVPKKREYRRKRTAEWKEAGGG